jgi:hypothetical protein
MNRKELIDKAAWEYAQTRSENRGIAYLTFKEIAEWADRTMVGKARDWLQCIDFDADYVTTDGDGRIFFNDDKFIEEFCKLMEE